MATKEKKKKGDTRMNLPGQSAQASTTKGDQAEFRSVPGCIPPSHAFAACRSTCAAIVQPVSDSMAVMYSRKDPWPRGLGVISLLGIIKSRRQTTSFAPGSRVISSEWRVRQDERHSAERIAQWLLIRLRGAHSDGRAVLRATFRLDIS